MKAAVIKEPGRISVEEIPTPKAGRGDVLLKVDACALCGTDQRVLAGEKHVDVSVVGHEIAGIAVEVGPDVTGIVKGAKYTVKTVIGCGRCSMCRLHRENLCEKGFSAIGYQFNGGFAEYILMPEQAVRQGCLIPIPRDFSSELATIIEPLSCCVNGMKYIPMEKTEHILIFGGGIIGVLNGLVARARGAQKISIADVSQPRLDLLKKLNLPFDNLINSAQTDVAEWVRRATGGRGVQAVVVAASVKSLAAKGLELLQRSGHLSVFAGMPKSDPVAPIDLNRIHYYELNIHGANSSSLEEYLSARDLLVSGRIDARPLVTHRFPLSDFKEAVRVQADPSTGALKVIIRP